MKIGFIGTGQITKAVVIGIISSKLKINKIYISERNKKISKNLKSKSKKIIIIKNNQEIITETKENRKEESKKTNGIKGS